MENYDLVSRWIFQREKDIMLVMCLVRGKGMAMSGEFAFRIKIFR